MEPESFYLLVTKKAFFDRTLLLKIQLLIHKQEIAYSQMKIEITVIL